MQKVQSNFVKPAGLAVLFVCALASAYFEIGLLFAVLTGVFLVCFIALAWTKVSLNKVTAEVKDRALRGFPGSEIRVPVKVSNGKLIPVVWLEVILDIPENECVRQLSKTPAVFSWVMPWQELLWNEPFYAVKRGICKAGRAYISSGDGFGLSERADTIDLPGPAEIVVYPALVDISVSLIINKLSEFEISKNGIYTDPTLLKTVRDYIPGDSARDINWRLLARQGEVYVNVRENMSPMRMCLILDLESFSYLVDETTANGPRTVIKLYEDEMERMISLAASIASGLSERGVRCSLVIPSYKASPGSDNSSEVSAKIVICEETADQTDMLLTALSGITYKGGKAEIPYGQVSNDLHKLGQIFCLSKSSDDLKLLLEETLDCSPLYIVQDGPEAQRTITEGELLR